MSLRKEIFKHSILKDFFFNMRMEMVKIIAPTLYKKCDALKLTWPRYKRDYAKIPRPSTLAMKELFQDKKISGAEIGVLRGFNSESLLKELNIEKLYLVDLWEDYEELDHYYSNETNFKIILEKFVNNEKVEIIRLDSALASQRFKDNSLDFCYIDANHQYEYVLKDLFSWYPKIKEYGIISGHDIFSHLGVLKAIKDFCNIKGIRFFVKEPDFYFIKHEGEN